MTTAQLCDRYRPRALSEVVGNPRTLAVLSALSQRPFASAWLLEGPSGVGKTSAALCVAGALASDMDITHVNGTNVNAEAVREWSSTLRVASWRPDGWRVLVIDEADRMSHAAQVLFLSLLEALPPRALVLFTSNEKGDFEPRFLSRVKALHFTGQGMAKAGAGRLEAIARAEGIALSPKDAVRLMQTARNNVRAAIQELELLGMVVAA